MTPARLEAKQLANPVVAVWHAKLRRRRDWASLYVWREVVSLLAGTQEPGVLRRGVDVLDDDSMADFVAVHLGCDEDEAAPVLRTLSAAGLLHVEDDGLTLPVVPRRRGQPGEVRDLGGRPRSRSGETKEQARERRLAEQEQKAAAERAQGNMLHSIPGGKGGTAAKASGNLSPKTQNLDGRFSGEVSDEVSEGVSEGVFDRETAARSSEVSSRGVSTAAAAAAAKVEESTSYQQQQQQRVPDSRAQAREAENSAAGVSGGVFREVSAEVFAEVFAEVAEASANRTGVSAEAAAIAADLVRGLDLRGAGAAQAGSIVQGWRNKGCTVEDILEGTKSAVERRGEIGSLKWFSDKVRDAARARVARETPTESTETRPEILAVPAWCETPLFIRNGIAEFLAAAKLPPGPERDQRLFTLRNHQAAACYHARQHDPALSRLVEAAVAKLEPGGVRAAAGA